MSKSSGSAHGGNAAERRRAKRRQVLDTFAIFASIPKKGGYQLTVHDLSDVGIGFDYDTEGEIASETPIKKGEKLEVHLYLNRSLYLSLGVTVARIEDVKTVRRIGAEFNETGTPAFAAFAAFLGLVDRLSEMPVISGS
jgi:hypothetical protein